ncbi:MAG: 3-phosphoshikimate 1-carboxyvinyltransferase [Sandaracinaceae bacterium]|nr:3-phosphoshikimate 1-carboxyvinyltransferase [Sandaracinaceae bacterium]
MKQYRVRTSQRLSGTARVASDKSIGHRALILAALAEGECVLDELTLSGDVRATQHALMAMGVVIREQDESTRVQGVGLRGLQLPNGHIDCGNSGTTMRLIAGLLCAQHFGTRLVGDASLSRRPMKRIVDPLRARGAHIMGTVRSESTELFPPLSVAPLVKGESLLGIEYEMPVASAQVKSALLLSGLYANGLTALREPTLSRDHTERMLAALGVPIERMASMVVLDPVEWRGGWDAFRWTMPGDLSAAAFLIAAAQLVPKSVVEVVNVGVNPTRTGMLDALRSMRAQVNVVPGDETVADEPTARIHIEQATIARGRVGGELTTRMIDDVPAYAALALSAPGKTEIRDAEELRVKESDRIASTILMLRAFGVTCGEFEDGLWLEGTDRLRAATVDCQGDHRIAMAAACIGLRADGETIVRNVECVQTSFPGFARVLRSLGADIVEEEVNV